MHHKIDAKAVKRQRDELVAAYWAKEEAGAGDIGGLVAEMLPVFKDVAENAFNKGFYHGIVIGFEHGAKSGAVLVGNDVADIFGFDLPEGEV